MVADALETMPGMLSPSVAVAVAGVLGVVEAVATADVRSGACVGVAVDDAELGGEVGAEGVADDRETVGVEEGVTGAVITAMCAGGGIGTGRTSR